MQQTIIKGIKEQLFFNDYLVLPGFGGFVLKSSPAHFSGTGASLIPPSKTVSFNAQLKQNDGILVIWLQKQLNCSAAESQRHLLEFSEYCSSILNTKRRLSLEGIGFFYLDFENNICFEPQHEANFLSSSFGLSPLSVLAIEPEIKATKKEVLFVDRTPERVETEQRSGPVRLPLKKLASYAFAGFVVLSLLFLLVANSKTQGELRSSLFGGYQIHNYVPEVYPELTISSPVKSNKAYVADANGIAVMDLNASKSVAVKAVETFSEASGTLHHEVKNYQVVLGCFSILKNAQRMVKKLASENITAHVSEKNAKGLYVVSNGDFSSKQDALEKLITIKGSFPNAWVKQPE